MGERFWNKVRKGMIGRKHSYHTVFGKQTLLYADWTASGRLYQPIEEKMAKQFGPMVANTHTESSETGAFMTKAYAEAVRRIKRHVGARADDVFIATGTGATGAICKWQRLLNVRYGSGDPGDKPVVFITHMEHHSNHTSWLECNVDVVVVPPDKNGKVCLRNLEAALKRYRHRSLLIGSFTACSNVTGIFTPYHQMAALMHQYNGLCFVDFAASAPYVSIDMHPEGEAERLDAIFFSPHKFLGGPGTSGVLLFDRALYGNQEPDHPGGGTVHWTNPWGEKSYIEDVEAREDGGTPGYLQVIRTALAIGLKEEMMAHGLAERERAILSRLWEGLRRIPNVHVLDEEKKERLPIVSFYIEGLHYNFITKILSDRFGIQARGGCSCAGTYGHYLLDIEKDVSKLITDSIDTGNMALKPGWVRLSLHPTMTNKEVDTIVDALALIGKNGERWQKEYEYDEATNEFYPPAFEKVVDWEEWFRLD
ncbi:aminotransferase class V-fold PLP-dependent enzyme [Halobacillus litoralis]|uniref:aminotransferase class V-fold PLP-dependent enzyme n=1 Tax=Halobacillus litoralis TaxID=45668 RepID=UPI001CFE7092|nr:aminotransferase class V-fold PLP-dependent enzyme [Halobacillus litoralis]